MQLCRKTLIGVILSGCTIFLPIKDRKNKASTSEKTVTEDEQTLRSGVRSGFNIWSLKSTVKC